MFLGLALQPRAIIVLSAMLPSVFEGAEPKTAESWSFRGENG